MEEKTETDDLLKVISEELKKIVESSPNEAENKEDAAQADNVDISSIEGVSAEAIEAIENTSTPLVLADENYLGFQRDVKKMHSDLDKSYELFRSISDKFENMSFSNLAARIKDLNMDKKYMEKGEGDPGTAQRLRALLDTSIREKTLNKLTTTLSEQFKEHPGEFGDIPEVSNFFQACTQLQHGLEKLKKQSNSAEDLFERMYNATEEKFQRVDEINKILSKTQGNTTAATTAEKN